MEKSLYDKYNKDLEAGDSPPMVQRSVHEDTINAITESHKQELENSKEAGFILLMALMVSIVANGCLLYFLWGQNV